MAAAKAKEGPATNLFKINEESKKAAAACAAVGQAGFRKLLELIVTEITVSAAEAEALLPAVAAAFGTADAFASAHSYIYEVLRVAVRQSAEAPDIAASLAASGLPDALCRDVAAVGSGRRQQLAAGFAAAAPCLPTVSRLRWRVDVAISSSALNRIMRPSVLLEVSLSDGRIKTMEVPLDAFHALRYSVAKVLGEMAVTEQHPVLRIA